MIFVQVDLRYIESTVLTAFGLEPEWGGLQVLADRAQFLNPGGHEQMGFGYSGGIVQRSQRLDDGRSGDIPE
jgi:hypothetical protein